MGLNLNWPRELPEDISATASSVNHLIDAAVDREAVLVARLRRYDEHLSAIADPKRREVLLATVRTHSATIGRDVRVETANGSFEGSAVGIDDDGRLLIHRDGSTTAVTVGDIIHARLLR
jgi:BirA family biotin operon repressor/biotin-[acetyl-CoA-carboxylase] ligase